MFTYHTSRSKKQLRMIFYKQKYLSHTQRLAYAIMGVALDPNDGYRATHTKLQGKTRKDRLL